VSLAVVTVIVTGIGVVVAIDSNRVARNAVGAPSTTASPEPSVTTGPVQSTTTSPLDLGIALVDDVDCAGGSGDRPVVDGPITVTGSDPHELDRDGDGVGCED
jgi:hypothetical protein